MLRGGFSEALMAKIEQISRLFDAQIFKKSKFLGFEFSKVYFEKSSFAKSAIDKDFFFVVRSFMYCKLVRFGLPFANEWSKPINQKW